MSTNARIAALEHEFDASAARLSRSARYAAGVLVLAVAYYGSAKIGQSLRYTASVSAVWPPAGVGIGALYLFGLRWWPGIFLGELVINSELVLGNSSLPLGSVAGQQLGNMAEIVVGALLLRLLIGQRAASSSARARSPGCSSPSASQPRSARPSAPSRCSPGGVIDTARDRHVLAHLVAGRHRGRARRAAAHASRGPGSAGAVAGGVRHFRGRLVIAPVAAAGRARPSRANEPLTYI